MKKTILIALLLLCAPVLLAMEGEEEKKAPVPEEKALPPAKPEAEKNPVAVIKTSLGVVHVELFADETPETVANFLGLAEGTREWKDVKTGEMTKRPFYDGLVFHRVIKGFMIQGGCPRGNGTGGPGYSFEDEINANALGLEKLKAVENGRPHPWLLVRSQQDFQRIVLGPVFRNLGIKSQEELDERQADVQKAVEALTLKDVYEGQGYEYREAAQSHHPEKGVIAMANSGPKTNGSQFFINLEDTPHLTGKHTVFGKVVKGMEVVEKIGEVKVEPRSSRPLEDVKILSIRKLVEEKGEEKSE